MSRSARTLLVSFLLGFGASALRAQTATEFDLPPQPLAESLKAVGIQAKLNVVSKPSLVDGRHAPALKGTVTPQQALTHLLASSGLEYQFVNDKTVVIRSAQATADTPARRDVRKNEGQERPLALAQAQAQNASGPTEKTSSASDRASSVSQRASGEDVEEIVVTAQKRSERLQDVPISMTILRGDRLEQSSFQGVSEALTTVPGVKLATDFQSGGTQISMRGVSASAPTAAGSNTVGYYIDSVPFGFVRSALVPDANVYDLQRIEVLRGPQGTLYGASALNGVIRVLTNEAALDKFEFKGRALVSNTDGSENSYRGDAALNVPLMRDRLAARLVLGYNRLGGWIDSPNQEDVNDGTVKSARLRLNAQPTEDLSLALSAWLSRSEFDAPPVSDDAGNIPSLIDQPQNTDFDAFGLRIAHDFSLFTLTSMTSYIDFSNDNLVDLVPFNPVLGTLASFGKSRLWSEELLLSSNQKGSWRWSVGGFYRDAKDSGFQVGSFFPRVDGSETSESVAAFGEITRLLADGRFEMTAGLRYFEDEVSLREVPSPPQFIPPSTTFDTVSPRVVLTWNPSSDLTLYGSYSEGFRSGFEQGAFVRITAPGFPAVAEDTLRSYEIGARGSGLAKRLTFDAAVFYIDWQDIQQVLTVPFTPVGAPQPIPVAAPVNAGSASGLGAEFVFTARPFDSLSFGASLGWNDLTFDNDVVSANRILFAEGERPSYSAEYTVGSEMSYEARIGASGYMGRFQISGNYSSEQSFRTLIGVARGDDILIVRSSLTLDAPSGWSLTLFGDNLNDEDGAEVRPTSLINFRNAHPRPRTYGLQLEYRY